MKSEAERTTAGRITRAAAVASAILLSIFLAVLSSPAVASQPAQPAGAARLDSRLARLVEAYQQRGIEGASAVAAELDIDLQADSVRVIVESGPGPGDAEAVTRRLGASVEGTYQDLVQTLVPIASLEPLARAGPVQFVRPPLRAVPMVTGQGVALINADDWQAAGITGAGVKVAVLDLGFQGYQSRLGTELPAAVTAQSFRADGDITGGGEVHGTAVAEVVTEVAPGINLYLVNFETEVELGNASAWLTGQGVKVINASWGYFVSGPGDGTGLVDDIVSTSAGGGTLWSVAAANHAQRHWSGPFLDSDGDLFHEFQNNPFEDEGNQVGSFFGVFAGEVIGAELKWNDPFGAACRDYDLYLKRTDDAGQPLTVASSVNVQNDGTGCVPGADPIESLSHTVVVSDIYHLVIKKSVAPTNANLHLYSFYHDLEYQVAANSLSQPADNPGVMAVGAVPWSSPNTIEPYSSRGPTTDNRIKPDIAGPDAVSTATYSPFSFGGTSAAAPHGTGAAALARQRLPCYTPTQLRSYLETNVVDLGSPGKDNTYGSGRLLLGSPPADADADGLGDDCDPCPGNPDCDGDSSGCVPSPCAVTGPAGSACPSPALPLPVFRDCIELFLGTDVTDSCPDDAADDAWAPDANRSGASFRRVDGLDMFLWAQRFGSTTAATPSGKLPYLPRYDLNADGAINGLDIFILGLFFNKTCQ